MRYNVGVQPQNEDAARFAKLRPANWHPSARLCQSTAIVGSLPGILLANGTAQWIVSAKPQFMIVFDPLDGAQALVAGLGMALLASIFPTRVVANLAPAEVFRK